MILRPTAESYKVIGYYTGKVIAGFSLLMAFPVVVSVGFREFNTALDFTIGLSLCLIIGLGLQFVFRTKKDLSWAEGMVVTAGAWMWMVLIAAIPVHLSGHYGSFIDAIFDVMSGFSTTGLTLIQDLDHVSNGLNTWRHLLTYAGGQGIVVIALTFLLKGTAGAYKMYVGEAKDERLLPNIVQTARAIWTVSLIYLAIGTAVFFGVNLWLGMEPLRAFFVGLWSFCGSWSTGGFAPMSYNTMYYHSALHEVVTLVIAVAGSMNFALHWAIWTGRRSEIRRNIEIISFVTTLMILMTLAMYAVAKAGVYGDSVSLFRKVAYVVISAHTGTGFSTVYSSVYIQQWGPAAMIAITIAMMLGAGAASTAGGIKAIRVGIITKAIISDVKKMIMPETAVLKTRMHHLREQYLTDKMVRSAMTITILFVTAYFVSGVVGVFYGYGFVESLFDGASALSTTGLSAGVTDPGMETGMKVMYTLLMWIGRLEFMSLMALAAHTLAIVKGR